MGTDMDMAVTETLSPLSVLHKPQLYVLLQESSSITVFAGSALPSHVSYVDEQWFLLSGTLRYADNADPHNVTYYAIDASSTFSALPLCVTNINQWQATTDCTLLRVPSQRLDQLLTWSQTADFLLLMLLKLPEFDEDRQWVSQLLNSNLFFKVPPLNLLLVIDGFSPLLVEAGEVVIREGERGGVCYFIKEGIASVVRHSGEHTPPELVATLRSGACFGEDALINDAPRNASVIMKTEGVLMVLHKSRFLQLLRSPPIRGISAAAWQKLGKVSHAIPDQTVFIDVRSTAEYAEGSLNKAINMPLGLLPLHLRRLSQTGRIIAFCDTGNRSAAAAHLLRREGFDATFIEGGVKLDAWANLATHHPQLTIELPPANAAV